LSDVAAYTVLVYVVGVAVISGACTSSFHVAAAVARHPAAAVFDDPNTACSANASGPTVVDEFLSVHELPPTVTVLMLVGLLDSAHFSLRIPVSLVTVTDDVSLANWAFGVPLHVSDCVELATPFTATDFVAVIVTSMFSCAGFAASAPVDSPVTARIAPSHVFVLVFMFVLLAS